MSVLIISSIVAQENPLDKFNNLIGKWEGSESGFSSSKSVIQSEFNWMLNNPFIEVKNRSEFEQIHKNQRVNFMKTVEL